MRKPFFATTLAAVLAGSPAQSEAPDMRPGPKVRMMKDFDESKIPPTAKKNWAGAIKAMNTKDWKSCVTEFNAAIRQGGYGISRAHSHRGFCLARLGQLEASAADLEKAIELEPKLKEIMKASLTGTYFRIGYQKAADKNFGGAKRWLLKAAEADRTNSEALSELAFVHLQLREWKPCIQIATKAIGLDTGNHLAYSNRGTCRYSIEKHREALEDFTQAMELNPNSPETYLNRAATFSALKRCPEAKSDFTKALELRSDFAAMKDAVLGACKDPSSR